MFRSPHKDLLMTDNSSRYGMDTELRMDCYSHNSLSAGCSGQEGCTCRGREVESRPW